MRTLEEIKKDIDRLSDRRAEVLHELSEGHDATLASEHKLLDEQLAELWDEQRMVRATIRFGDRDLIIGRARQEGRLARAARGPPAPLLRGAPATLRLNGALAQLG